MATLDGQAIFGTEVKTLVQDQPREVQRVSFFGINGQAQIDGGARGRGITVTGKLAGPTPADVGFALWQTIYGFRDGNTHLLTDNDGSDWIVTLDSLNETGKLQLNARTGLYQRTYSAQFYIF